MARAMMTCVAIAALAMGCRTGAGAGSMGLHDGIESPPELEARLLTDSAAGEYTVSGEEVQVDTDGNWSLVSEWKRHEATGEWQELSGADTAPPPPSDLTHRNKKIEWGKVNPDAKAPTLPPPERFTLLYVGPATWRDGARNQDGARGAAAGETGQPGGCRQAEQGC